MNRIAFTLAALLCINVVNAQNLKVMLSPDDKKVSRGATNGISSIVFESHVKNLNIINEDGDEFLMPTKDLFVYRITPYTDSLDYSFDPPLPVYPKRTFILKSPYSSEYVEQLEDILPNTVYYYTVTLPNQFPTTFTAEYLVSKSAQHGVRVSFGKRFGGYVAYKWGKYKPSGNNIDNVSTDCNLTKAKKLGYIRTAITGGLRMGLFYPSWKENPIGLYLLIGGGYGEYGRQWENPTQVEGNIYFYSDYIKGFNGDLALQCTFYKWLTLSAGMDMLIGNGRISIDYQVGLGVNLDTNKIFKKKRI